MVERKTTIIVGAGASAEVGLPVGEALKQYISERLSFKYTGRTLSGGDKEIYRAIQVLAGSGHESHRDFRRHLDACDQISRAMPLSISIDNFIDARQDSTEIKACAKLAITQSILAAERESPLFVDRYKPPSPPNWNETTGSWFNRFFRLITENCPLDTLPKRLQAITLIVFNYDRCVEHFLHHALQTYYGVEASESAAALESLEIYHPYGAVGKLPWQKEKPTIDFGAEAQAQELVALSSQIQTFSEGTDPDSSQIALIRDRFSQAQILVFLGFAFHQLNLDLLRPSKEPKARASKAKCFGTALGLSPSNCALIERELQQLKSQQIAACSLRNDLTCERLFEEYSRSLTVANWNCS